jgi:hypothetical protein
MMEKQRLVYTLALYNLKQKTKKPNRQYIYETTVFDTELQTAQSSKKGEACV